MNQKPRNLKPGSTSHKTEEELTEFFDKPEKLLEDVNKTAELIKKSKHCVIYTGAGVSTSAKIPDFRGPNGVWTLKDLGKSPKGISIDQALPTYCHYAIVELVKKNYVKHVVSTNCDGLHRRSGLSQEELSELHGNCYKEQCSICEKEYLRPFNTVKTVYDRRSHKTGRFCEDPFCKGELLDTTVAFGETLPIKELEKGNNHSKKADLTLVLGTSMRVSPACNMPLYTVKQGGNMILVNLQTTPYDKDCTIRSFSKTDEFIQLLMKELNLTNFNQSFDYREILKKEEKVKYSLKESKSILQTRFLSTMSFCKDKNNRNCIVIVGGLGKGENRYPPIEILTDDGVEVLKKGDNESLPFIYKQRWGHSASVIPSISRSEIYLIGGFDHTHMFNSVTLYNVIDHTIKYIETTGDQMTFRAGHSSCVFQDKILIFGGQVYSGNGSYDYLNDFYSFDPKTKEWKKYKTSGDVPSPRSQHQSIIYKNMMILIGGCDKNTYYNDVFALNLEKMIWKKLDIEGLPSKVNFNVKNMYPAQFSCIILKKSLYIYGLCHENSCYIIDLEKMKCIKDKTLSDFESDLSCALSINPQTAFMFRSSKSKWIGAFIKEE